MKAIVLKQILVVTSILGLSFMCEAKDYGINGNTFKIIEQPFLQMIDERLQRVDIEKEKQKMETVAKERIYNPMPVHSVTPAKESRTFYYDPTYTLDQDAILPCGKILHKAGTTVNPLQHMELGRRLIFIDARESKQIKWLKNKLIELEEEQQSSILNKVILVGGSPLKLEEDMKIDIYYDQGGVLTNKFGISHSPAVVMQEETKLKIEEVAL